MSSVVYKGAQPKTPQWRRVMQYMQDYGMITSAIAFDALRITSLHRRLTDIERKTDYRIDRKRIDVPNRPHHFEYRLGSPADSEQDGITHPDELCAECEQPMDGADGLFCGRCQSANSEQ
jgi:hypothetical protein